jgi:hypothetical protein
MEWIVFCRRRIHPLREHSHWEWLVFLELPRLFAGMAHQINVVQHFDTRWKETSMTATPKESASDREILLVGPYGVLGTGVIDAVAANAPWRVTTAARRPAPPYRTQAQPRHISVDLMDREGTIKAFSNLDTVTDLVYAAFVEKPTMAETVAIQATCPERRSVLGMSLKTVPRP